MQVDLDLEGAKKFLKLADAIEELDDVQNVYSNANVSAEVALLSWKPSSHRPSAPLLSVH